MRSLNVFVSCIALGTLALSATAQNEPPARPAVRPARPADAGAPQPGGPGGARPQQLSPEKAKAAWEVEATGVAKRAMVEDAKIKDVVKAYSEARASYDAAAEKMRAEMRAKAEDKGGGNDKGGGGGGRGAEMMKAMEDLNKAEREKLQKALGAAVSQDQTTKLMASLGTFNRQWDAMADSISGFGLEAKKQQDALNAVEDYVVAQAKIRGGGPDADPEARRSANQESRTKLTDSLKKVLSEEQMKKLEPMLGGGRGRGPGGPGGGGGGGQGGGGGGGY